MSDEANENPSLSLGDKLKQAREAKKLDIKEVARKLKFKPEVLMAMEQNDYSDTRSEVFARGYLKSYARLLALDEAEVLADFEQHAYAGSIATHKPQFIQEESYAVKQPSFRWVSYLIVLLIIALVVWWGYDHTGSSKIIADLPNVDNHLQQLQQKPEPQTLEIKPQSMVGSKNLSARAMDTLQQTTTTNSSANAATTQSANNSSDQSNQLALANHNNALSDQND